MAANVEPNQVGKREDLADYISNIDARATPLMTMIPKGPSPKSMLVEWQADEYDKPKMEGVPDGKDVPSYENAGEHRAMLAGRAQKMWRPWLVGDLAENVSDVAGLRSERANSIAKKLVELKRDGEAVIGSDNESQEDNNVDGSKTRGLGKWIQATAQNDLPVPAAFRTPAAQVTTAALNVITESAVNDIMQSLHDITGESKRYIGVFGSKLRSRFTQFALVVPQGSEEAVVRQFTQQATSKKVVNTIDVYEGDFGTIEIVTSNFLNVDPTTRVSDKRRGYLLDMNLLELGFRRRPGNRDLPDLGGGPRGVIDMIFCLKAKNPTGLAKFASTADS